MRISVLFLKTKSHWENLLEGEKQELGRRCTAVKKFNRNTKTEGKQGFWRGELSQKKASRRVIERHSTQLTKVKCATHQFENWGRIIVPDLLKFPASARRLILFIKIIIAALRLIVSRKTTKFRQMICISRNRRRISRHKLDFHPSRTRLFGIVRRGDCGGSGFALMRRIVGRLTGISQKAWN